jgi:hypothetical protein
MGFWSALTGKKVHCTGCGMVIPIDRKDAGSEVYCSDACRVNYVRLSSAPPPCPPPGGDTKQETPFELG